MAKETTAKITPVKVVAQCSFAAPGWVCDKGDVIEVSLPDARRMVARGMARELPEAPLPRASEDEVAAARVLDVETASRIVDRRNKLEKAIRVRPLQRRGPARGDLEVEPVAAGRVEE